MRVITTLFLCIFLFGTSWAQRNKKEFKIPISEFSEVVCKGDFTIYLTQDSMAKLALVGSQKSYNELEVTQDGKVLEITDAYKNDSPMELFLNYRILDKINLFGKVEMESRLLCAFDTLDVHLSGKSTIKLIALAPKVSCYLETVSKANIQGNIDKLRIECLENSSCRVEEIQNLRTTLVLDDYSKGYIQTNQALYGRVGESAQLEIKGKPKPFDMIIDEGGQIIREKSLIEEGE
jgi:hypothetical protein